MIKKPLKIAEGSASDLCLKCIRSLSPAQPSKKDIADSLGREPSQIAYALQTLVKYGHIAEIDRDGEIFYVATTAKVDCYPHLRARIVPPSEWRRSSGA